MVLEVEANAGAFQDETREYDAILIVSFGGPEGMDDVLPFLENVLRGKNIPRARMEEVGHHYEMFGGVSPLNEQTRALIAALRNELAVNDIDLPVYWGNRNWHPFLAETLREMRDDGIRRAIAFFPSPYSSYSSCRQYREDIVRAQEEVGDGAPEIDRIRMFFNHPGFIEPNVENLKAALNELPADEKTRVVFTAHSIPMDMANNSAYVAQLQSACELVAAGAEHDDWALVYQSRSGPPHQPWLEPDVCDYLGEINGQGIQQVVIMPIGFISDHMEVLFDLDTEAKEKAEELGMGMVRADTVGTHPRFIQMIRQLIVERMTANPERPALGELGAVHDICYKTCCLMK